MLSSQTPHLHQVLAKRATYGAQDSNEHREASELRSKSVDSSSNARLACPFFKADRRTFEANAICARTTWRTIPRLKYVLRFTPPSRPVLHRHFLMKTENTSIGGMRSSQLAQDVPAHLTKKKILKSICEQRSHARSRTAAIERHENERHKA